MGFRWRADSANNIHPPPLPPWLESAYSYSSSSENNDSDWIGGVPLYNCPHSNTTLGEVFQYPTVVLSYILLGATCLLFAGITAWKYNSVRVFNKKIRTPNVSNTLWIMYFVSLACRATLDAVRYCSGVVLEKNHANVGLFMGSLVLDGLVTLCLTLTLYHQKKFRSTVATPVVPPPKPDPQATERNSIVEFFWLLVTAPETYFCIIFLIYLWILLLTVNYAPDDTFSWVFMSTYAAQRLPVVILTLLICTAPYNLDGPSIQSKIILFVGVVLNLSLIFPPTIWASILSPNCVFYIGTLVDLLQLLFYISLVFFFIFLRAEYQRNMEECIWTTVSQIQDTFDFRRF